MIYYTNNLVEYEFNLPLKRNAVLAGLAAESDKFIDLKNMFCTSIITKPSPNSTADKIKKKKVSDNRFKLS